MIRRPIPSMPPNARVLRRLKQMDAARGHRGHAHFWDRAFSRRRFLQAAGAAAGVLGAGGFAPLSASPRTGDPKPIPGGFQPFLPGDPTVFHNYVPGVFDPPNTDPSGIFDFNGHIAFAVIDGSGTGRNTLTNATSTLAFEGDVRFMQGVYIALDGKYYNSTFVLLWLDLFTDPSDPNSQIHDFNPGIEEDGLFWILRVPDSAASINPAAGRARLTLTDLDIEDYHDLVNALLDGPSVEAQVSLDCRWHDPIATAHLRNPDPLLQFTGLFTQTQASLEWSAQEPDTHFEFHSDPAATSTARFAEIGQERNGFFFS